MREMKSTYRVLEATFRGRDHLGDLNLDGRIILNGSLKKLVVLTEFICCIKQGVALFSLDALQ
jgi:hypothetical protein